MMFLDAGAGLSEFITSITGSLADFSVTNLGVVLVAAVGVAAPLVLAWFAFRKVRNAATGGLKKGKL